MNGENKSKPAWNARQQKLLMELVRNPNIKAAAQEAGVGRSTANRWLGEPAFARELDRLRNEAMSEALGSVKSLTTRAAEELTRLLDTEDERLRRYVCRDILSHAIKVRELEDIEKRLLCLEEKIKHTMKGPFGCR